MLVSVQARLAHHQIQALDTLLDWFLFIKPASEGKLANTVAIPALSVPGLYTNIPFEDLNTPQLIGRIRDWQNDYAHWYLATQL